MRNAPNALHFTFLSVVSIPLDVLAVAFQRQRRVPGDYLAKTVAVKVIEPFSPDEVAAEADSDSGDDDAGSSSLHKKTQ